MVMDIAGRRRGGGGRVRRRPPGAHQADKAKLVVQGRATPTRTAERDRVHVQPDRVLALAVGHRSSATTPPSRPAAPRSTRGSGPLTLTMQLFFDDFASAKGDVTPRSPSS